MTTRGPVFQTPRPMLTRKQVELCAAIAKEKCVALEAEVASLKVRVKALEVVLVRGES